jgi:hypothetical protein
MEIIYWEVDDDGGLPVSMQGQPCDRSIIRLKSSPLQSNKKLDVVSFEK